MPKKCKKNFRTPGIRLKNTAPNKGPRTVPAPPIITTAMNVT